MDLRDIDRWYAEEIIGEIEEPEVNEERDILLESKVQGIMGLLVLALAECKNIKSMDGQTWVKFHELKCRFEQLLRKEMIKDERL